MYAHIYCSLEITPDFSQHGDRTGVSQ